MIAESLEGDVAITFYDDAETQQRVDKETETYEV